MYVLWCTVSHHLQFTARRETNHGVTTV